MHTDLQQQIHAVINSLDEKTSEWSPKSLIPTKQIAKKKFVPFLTLILLSLIIAVLMLDIKYVWVNTTPQ